MKTLTSGQGNRLLATLLSGILVGMSILFSTSASAQDNLSIENSVHDFRAQLWGNNSNSEICVVCHTPHNAISPDDGPLWNRDVSLTSFTLYDDTPPPGSDLQGTNFTNPSGVSRLCLSCHDGTIAIDAFGGQTSGGGAFMDDINPAANLGDVVAGTGDLSNDHPVSFTFPAGLDAELYAVTDGKVNGVMPLFGAGQDQVECASCHDVHATNTYDQLLRVDNDGSDLCLTCHIK